MDHPRPTPARFRGHAVEPLAGVPGARRAALIELAAPGRTGRADAEMAAAPGVPLSAVLDTSAGPDDVLDLQFLEAFSAGRQPFSRSREVENVRPAAGLLPSGARVVRDVETEYLHSRLAAGDGWTLRAVRWKRGRRAGVTVTAVTAELAEELLAQATADASEPKDETDERVSIGFWHLSARGPRRIPRDIDAATWPQIRGNYSGRVSTALEPLMTLTPTAVNGRLLLLHGPPGTGKTTLLRGIARQWQEWCRVDCVLDPERLFAAPSYLLDVALGADEDDDDAPPWRMLLLEDCDELIRGEAKSTSGQQLSRLLNLTDGLLGQGRNVLVAITTNEDLSVLHPAVVRPGRSLAQVEVGRLTPAEATAWLAAQEQADDETADDGPAGGPAGIRSTPSFGPQGATLAELFALRAGNGPALDPEPSPGTGLYL